MQILKTNIPIMKWFERIYGFNMYINNTDLGYQFRITSWQNNVYQEKQMADWQLQKTAYV